jgi:hypothetical protein
MEVQKSYIGPRWLRRRLAVSRELTGRERLARLGGGTFAGPIGRPVSRDVIVSGNKALFAYLIARFD